MGTDSTSGCWCTTAVRVRDVRVAANVSNQAVALERLLGSKSSLSVLSGSNTNITLGGDELKLAANIALGATQTALVQEEVGTGPTFLRAAYAVNVTGSVVPSVLPTARVGQAYSYALPHGSTIAWQAETPAGLTFDANTATLAGTLA